MLTNVFNDKIVTIILMAIYMYLYIQILSFF